jgi:hypothetical protein
MPVESMIGLFMCLLTGVWAKPAHAVSPQVIQITITGHATGSLGGQPFNDAAFAFVGLANPANVKPLQFGSGRYVDHQSASILIAGFGNADFTIPTRTWVSWSVTSVGIGKAGALGLDFFAIPGPAAAGSWHLNTPFSQFDAPTLFVNPPQFSDIPTSLGLLTIAQHATNGAFRADLVPEPGSMAIAGLCVAGVLAFCRRHAASW